MQLALDRPGDEDFDDRINRLRRLLRQQISANGLSPEDRQGLLLTDLLESAISDALVMHIFGDAVTNDVPRHRPPPGMRTLLWSLAGIAAGALTVVVILAGMAAARPDPLGFVRAADVNYSDAADQPTDLMALLGAPFAIQAMPTLIGEVAEPPFFYSDTTLLNGEFVVTGPDPFTSFNIEPGTAGSDAHYVGFDLSCVEGPSDLLVQLYWWGDDMGGPKGAASAIFLAGTGRNIVPMSPSASWSSLRELKGVRIDIHEPTRCSQYRIGNVGLYS